MTITPSPLIPKNDSVAESGIQLWEPSAIFLPNWRTGVNFGTSWRTTIIASRSEAEQRFGKVNKPFRTQTIQLRGLGAANTQRFRSLLHRLGRSRSPWPIFPDAIKLVGRLTPDDNIYVVEDTTNRRLQTGERIVALLDSNMAIASAFAFQILTSFTNTQMTLAGDLGETYDVPPNIVHQNHFLPLAAPGRLTYVTSEGVLGTVTTVKRGQVVVANFVSVHDAPLINFVSAKALSFPRDAIGNLGEEIEELDITASVFSDLGVTGGEAGRSIRMVSVAWIVPPTWHQKRIGIAFTLDSTATFIPRMSQYIIGKVHQFEPIFATAGQQVIPAGPPFSLVDIDVNTRMDNNLILSFHMAAQSFNDSWSSFGPGISSNELGQGNSDYLTQPYIVGGGAGGSPVNMNATLTQGGGGDNHYAASAICLQQKEDPGSVSHGFIFPVMECAVEVSNVSNVRNDEINEVSISVEETPGISAIDPLIPPGTVPGAFTIHSDGNPIMHLPINWADVRMGIHRLGKRESTGITHTFTAFGERPGETFTLPFYFNGREDIWKLLEFFDSRAGRLHPWWLISPSAGVRVNSITGMDTLHLDPNTTERDWEIYKNIGVRDVATGVLSIHAITLSIEVGDEHLLTISPALPTSDVDDYDFATAHLCRFDTEEVSENWRTDIDMQVSLKVKELINEKTVSITLLDICGAGGGDSWCPDPEFDICEALRCGQEVGGCCMCGLFGVTLQVFCYLSQCCAGVDCIEECIPNGSCSVFLTYTSCIAGIIRWDGPFGTFVTLDTATISWTWDLGTLITGGHCCSPFGVDDCGQNPVFCCAGDLDACNGFPSPVDTETCCNFLREVTCTSFNLPVCTYLPVIKIDVAGPCGAGDALCA